MSVMQPIAEETMISFGLLLVLLFASELAPVTTVPGVKSPTKFVALG